MYKILIVEDDPSILQLLEMNFSVAGYQCDTASGGSEALDRIAAQRYDLAVLDIMLPEADGFELFPHMEKAGIPVIYVSAKGGEADRVKGLRLGAEDYLVKPFSILELLVRMEKVLSRNGKGKNVDTFLDLTIDYARHAVLRNGEEIPLKPMEFQLLEVLLKNRNIAVSREKLLGLVWGVDFVGETRTVDVHIGQLRKKLGLGDHIKTIPKIGYRLEDT